VSLRLRVWSAPGSAYHAPASVHVSRSECRLTNTSITAAIFSCCERGSLDAASNRRHILPVGPAPARLFFSVSLNNSSTETPNARAIGDASPAKISPASRS